MSCKQGRASNEQCSVSVRRKNAAILSTMTRRFVYMMLTIIALQLSWGVIAVYCQHESGRAAQHFGHHQHADTLDHSVVAAKDKSSAAKKATQHSHCSSCAHAPLSIDGLPEVALHPTAGSDAPISAIASLSSSYKTPPDRPQWYSAV